MNTPYENNVCPSIDELLRCDEQDYPLMIERLKKCSSQSDELKGVKRFLELNNYDLDKLKQFVSRSQDEVLSKIANKNRKQKSITKNLTFLKIAASVAVMVALTSLFFYYSPSKENVFEKYYFKDPGLPVFMADDENVAFDNFMNNYKLGNYAEALNQANSLVQQKETDTLLYFTGLIFFESGNINQAIKFFSRIADDSEFASDARWRRAMALWKLNMHKSAREIFISIPEGDEYFKVSRNILSEKEYSEN
jgi:tetratricopeptide (TPR) repeat protein